MVCLSIQLLKAFNFFVNPFHFLSSILKTNLENTLALLKGQLENKMFVQFCLKVKYDF